MTFRAKAPLCNAESAAGERFSPAAFARSRRDRRSAAFTLIELLVVMAIIGLLAAITLPSLKNMTRSNSLIAANRQMQDDLGYARQRAIADHTTVYVVFIPPEIADPTKFPPLPDPKMNAIQVGLYNGQYNTYALMSLRSVGEQPGRATPRYLTGWRSLPNGVFIAQAKFAPAAPPAAAPFPLGTGFPFPVSTNFPSPQIVLPYVGFDYLGRLTSGKDEFIPLARGSIFINPISHVADAQETPAGNSTNNINIVHVDWLTGRARIDKVEMQ